MPGDERVEVAQRALVVFHGYYWEVVQRTSPNFLKRMAEAVVAALDALPDPPPEEETDSYRFYERAREAEARVAVLQRQMEELREQVTEAWHKGAYGDVKLHEALGMTWDEYGVWVQDPSALDQKEKTDG